MKRREFLWKSVVGPVAALLGVKALGSGDYYEIIDISPPTELEGVSHEIMRRYAEVMADRLMQPSPLMKMLRESEVVDETDPRYIEPIIKPPVVQMWRDGKRI